MARVPSSLMCWMTPGNQRERPSKRASTLWPTSNGTKAGDAGLAAPAERPGDFFARLGPSEACETGVAAGKGTASCSWTSLKRLLRSARAQSLLGAVCEWERAAKRTSRADRCPQAAAPSFWRPLRPAPGRARPCSRAWAWGAPAATAPSSGSARQGSDSPRPCSLSLRPRPRAFTRQKMVGRLSPRAGLPARIPPPIAPPACSNPPFDI